MSAMELICIGMGVWAYFMHAKIKKIDELQNIIGEKLVEDIGAMTFMIEKVAEVEVRLNNLSDSMPKSVGPV